MAVGERQSATGGAVAVVEQGGDGAAAAAVGEAARLLGVSVELLSSTLERKKLARRSS